MAIGSLKLRGACTSILVAAARWRAHSNLALAIRSV
jgi:hypothetical protein